METTKARVEVYEELRKASEALDAKLKDDLQAPKGTTLVLEARVVKNSDTIAKEQHWVTKLEAKFADVKSMVSSWNPNYGLLSPGLRWLTLGPTLLRNKQAP